MNNVALITGGTRGIGFGIAQTLAHAGFDLVLCGMRPKDQVNEPIEKLKKLGIDTIYCQCDVADPQARTRMLSETKKHYGKLNILINNAGVAPKQRLDLLEATEESFEWVLKNNLQGPYFLTQAIANWMIQQKKTDTSFEGSIINVSSISATVASPGRGEYCISKAGVSMATQLFAIRLGEHNIPVYEVRPGITATDMTSGVKEKYDQFIADGLLVTKRWGTPQDVGKAVTSLATGHFPYSTGQVIMVDGGLTLERL